MPLGGALFCVVSGVIRSKVGTKYTILLFGISNFCGWLLLTLATNPLMVNTLHQFETNKFSIFLLLQLITGRFFIGIATGCYCFNIPVFVGEIASKEIRGILLTLFQAFVELGVAFVYTLGSLVSLTTLNIVCTTFVAIYTISFMLLPETPVYLVQRNKLKEAERSVRILQGSKVNAVAEVMNLKDIYERDTSITSKSSFLAEIKSRATQKAVFIVIFLYIIFQMSGINAIIFYTTTIFIEAGVTLDPAIATIVLGLVQVTMTFSTMFFIDRFGRIFLLTTSFIIMIIGTIGVGTFFYLKDIGTDLSDFGWLPLTSLCVFCIGFSSGMGSVPSILLGEVFSFEAKKVIAPFAQTFNNVMSAVIGILFPALVSAIGVGFTFYIFTGFCILGLIVTRLCIPETKGKSLDEIQKLLAS